MNRQVWILWCRGVFILSGSAMNRALPYFFQPCPLRNSTGIVREPRSSEKADHCLHCDRVRRFLKQMPADQRTGQVSLDSLEEFVTWRKWRCFQLFTVEISIGSLKHSQPNDHRSSISDPDLDEIFLHYYENGGEQYDSNQAWIKTGWKITCRLDCFIGFLLSSFLYPEMKEKWKTWTKCSPLWEPLVQHLVWIVWILALLIGFYATECGNILGWAVHSCISLIAVSLAKEEKEHTAEFLFAHPISRKDSHGKTDLCLVPASDIECDRVPVFIGSISLIGEEILWKKSACHLTYFLIQIELAGICLNLRIPAPQRTRHRTWYCHNDVFPEHYCQYLRSGKISEIYHPVWLCKRSRYCWKRQSGYRYGFDGDAVCCNRDFNRLLEVQQKRYSGIKHSRRFSAFCNLRLHFDYSIHFSVSLLSL